MENHPFPRRILIRIDRLPIPFSDHAHNELLVRIFGPRPNGSLHVSLVRFTVSEVECIEQEGSGVMRHYLLEAVQRPATELSALVDREAFVP